MLGKILERLGILVMFILISVLAWYLVALVGAKVGCTQECEEIGLHCIDIVHSKGFPGEGYAAVCIDAKYIPLED